MKFYSIAILSTLLLSNCTTNKKNYNLYNEVALKANQKYKCEWTQSSFESLEKCDKGEFVYGYEDECLHVFFKNTNQTAYLTIGKQSNDIGIEYIHYKENSPLSKVKGSHSYCQLGK